MFSVVIPTRDRVESLRRVVDVVRAQTVAPDQLVVVDDGSTDGTAAYLDSLDEDLTVVRSGGRGVSAARNAGLAAATQDFVVFVDDDDVPEPTWLEELAGLADDDVGLLGCGLRLHTPEGVSDWLPSAPDQSGVVFLPGAFAVRRTLMTEIGGYMAGLTYAENSELAMRLLPACRRSGLTIRTTDSVLHSMYHATERRSVVGRPEALLALMDSHAEEFAANPGRRAQFLAIAAVDLWRAGDRPRSRRLLRQAFWARPLSPRVWARAIGSHFPPLGSYMWGSTAKPVDH